MDRRLLLPIVCQHFAVTPRAVLSRKRTARIVDARHVCFYLLRHYGEYLSEIGRDFHRTHSTVFYAIKSLERKLDTERLLRERLVAIEAALEARGAHPSLCAAA